MKRNLHSMKRALRSVKRAICSMKTDLHSTKTQLNTQNGCRSGSTVIVFICRKRRGREYRSIFIEDRAPLTECRALFIECRFLFIEDRAPCTSDEGEVLFSIVLVCIGMHMYIYMDIYIYIYVSIYIYMYIYIVSQRNQQECSRRLLSTKSTQFRKRNRFNRYTARILSSVTSFMET